LLVCLRVLQLRNLEFEKAESLPASRTYLDPVPPAGVLDIGIEFGMADLVTSGDDRVGEIFPDTARNLPVARSRLPLKVAGQLTQAIV